MNIYTLITVVDGLALLRNNIGDTCHVQHNECRLVHGHYHMTLVCIFTQLFNEETHLL